MRANTEETRAVLVDLQLLLADYWREVDSNGAKNAGAYFTPDGEFHVGDLQSFRGPEGVNAFHAARLARAQRTTAHTFSNVTVELESRTRARMRAIVVNYGADGAPPITDLDGPSLISQLDMKVERGSDGAWRFALMRGDPVFIGKEPYTRQVLVEKR